MSKRRTLALPEQLRVEVEKIAKDKGISQHRLIEKAVELYTGCVRLEQRQGELTGFEFTNPDTQNPGIVPAMTKL